MSIPTNLVILVPPGTRVRYAENPHLDGQQLVAFDADQFENPKPHPTLPMVAQLDFTGIPLYDAERYEAPK